MIKAGNDWTITLTAHSQSAFHERLRRIVKVEPGEMRAMLVGVVVLPVLHEEPEDVVPLALQQERGDG